MRSGELPPPCESKLPPVTDPVDRAGVVVGDQQRAVLHLPGVDGSAPDLIALQPALGEDLVPRTVGRAERDHHHAETDLLTAIPRSALGEKRAVLVLGWEHGARVELDAVTGDVWTRLEQRRGELAARAATAELGIEDVALVAVGVAEVQALLRRHVEAIARHVLAQPVPAVGREVELLRHRVPVEAHTVAHAVRPVLEAGAVRIDARDVRVRVRRHAGVARRAAVEVELAVGTEGQVLPAVLRILRQRVVHDLHLIRSVELALDAFILRDALHLGYFERAVIYRLSVWQL